MAKRNVCLDERKNATGNMSSKWSGCRNGDRDYSIKADDVHGAKIQREARIHREY